MLRCEGSQQLFTQQFFVEPGIENSLTIASVKERFMSWLPFDASDFTIPFDVCVSYSDHDAFGSTIATNLARKMNGLSVATFQLDQSHHSHGKSPDEVFAYVAAKCRVFVPVLCHASLDALKKLTKDSACSDSAAQFLVQLTLFYNLLETHSAHACWPVTFGQSSGELITSPFDISCTDDLPSFCVDSVIERVQQLLRYVCKNEIKNLRKLTVRSTIVGLLRCWQGAVHSLKPVAQQSHQMASHEVSRFMLDTLNSISSSLQHLHQVWGSAPQAGDVKENGIMDFEELKQMIEVGNMKHDDYLQHIISVQAEQRRKQIPCVLLLLPNRESGADVIEKVQNWMKRKVMDELILVMQCEMRVCKNKLRACPHGVLWHRPEPTDPSDPPYGFKFSQPKESIRKLKTVLHHVTTVVKVCMSQSLLSSLLRMPSHFSPFGRCWELQPEFSGSMLRP
jgi:hypothetical protein